MVQTKEYNTLDFSEDLLKTSELEALSGVSTDACSDSSSSYFSGRDRKLERYIRARDRNVFCLTVINMIVTCVLLTKGATYFVYWNAFIVPALILHRMFDYYSKGWHFYMVDFCYVVNFLVITTTLFFPKNEIMSMVSFGLSLGTLSFSIYFFRNTNTFMSMDKITSLVIHNQAPLTMFLTHWHDYAGEFTTSAYGLKTFGFDFLSKWYGGIILCYGIWAVLYCATIFLVFGKHIKRRNLETLFSYTMSNPKNARKLLSRGAKWAKLLFMFHHFKMVLGLSSIAIVFYYSYWAGLLWLVVVNFIAIYNGATYCIEFQGAKYERQFLFKNKKF